MTKAVWRTAVAGAVAGMVTAGMLMIAAPASAHVTVNPSEAQQGRFARLDFRVPNESDTESTTELQVHFPEEAPIPNVSVAPVPGWSVEVTRRTLDQPLDGGHGEQITEVVDFITWTADSDDASIGPGEFLEFPVSAGPMPEVDELYFRALQTYSDDAIVRWIELPTDGGEASFPAPGLRLVADGAADDAGDDPAAEGDPADEADQSAAGEQDSGSGAGVWLGLAGLVAGLAGLAVGGMAFARTRQ